MTDNNTQNPTKPEHDDRTAEMLFPEEITVKFGDQEFTVHPISFPRWCWMSQNKIAYAVGGEVTPIDLIGAFYALTVPAQDLWKPDGILRITPVLDTITRSSDCIKQIDDAICQRVSQFVSPNDGLLNKSEGNAPTATAQPSP